MGENIIKRIARFISQKKVPVLRVAYRVLFWLMLATIVVVGFFVFVLSTSLLEMEYLSWAVFVNLLLLFLSVLLLSLVSRLAGYMKLHRFFKIVKPFAAVSLCLSLQCYAVVIATDHKWHIGEKTDTNVSDSLFLMNITQRMGYSKHLPIDRIAKFSQIGDSIRLTKLRIVARNVGQYEGHRHIYLFHKTSILEDICHFSELRELRIEGFSLMYSPHSLGRIPRELCQLKELRELRIHSSNTGKIPHEVEDMERFNGCDVWIDNRTHGIRTAFWDWMVQMTRRKQD